MFNMGQKSDVTTNKTDRTSIAEDKVQHKQVISGSSEKNYYSTTSRDNYTDYEYKDLEEGEINMSWKFWGMLCGRNKTCPSPRRAFEKQRR